jgi:short-subunit dehydrogenase
MLAARRADRIQLLAASLQQRYGVKALALPTDVTRRSDIDRMVDATESIFGGVDILINNAGIGLSGNLAEMDDRALRRLFDVNVFGAIDAMQAVIPAMRRRQGGVIANISSILGRMPAPSMGMVGSSSGYVASKYALQAFSACARMELATEKIHVLTVLPGRTVSEFDDHFLVGTPGLQKPASLRRSLLPAAPVEPVARRIIRAIEQREREVFCSWRDHAAVLAANALPGLYEWALIQLRRMRTR